ncbi:MAG TPA: 50S ribosomal L9 C-terminal domain-containing protein, partial [Spirochaetales bacterium]|nr:50S ribosomal L9 C-terminal domain-containing protein [Spirochaetales bacterium]
DRRKIDLDEPIRALGEYKIQARLHHDVRPEITVRVVKHDWVPGQDENVAAEAQEQAEAPEAGEAHDAGPAESEETA